MNIDGLVSIKFNSPFRTVPEAILPRDLWLLHRDGGGLTGIGDKVLSLVRAVHHSLKTRVFSTYPVNAKIAERYLHSRLASFFIILEVIYNSLSHLIDRGLHLEEKL